MEGNRRKLKVEKGEFVHSTPGKETPVEIKQLRYAEIRGTAIPKSLSQVDALGIDRITPGRHTNTWLPYAVFWLDARCFLEMSSDACCKRSWAWSSVAYRPCSQKQESYRTPILVVEDQRRSHIIKFAIYCLNILLKNQNDRTLANTAHFPWPWGPLHYMCWLCNFLLEATLHRKPLWFAGRVMLQLRQFTPDVPHSVFYSVPWQRTFWCTLLEYCTWRGCQIFDLLIASESVQGLCSFVFVTMFVIVSENIAQERHPSIAQEKHSYTS